MIYPFQNSFFSNSISIYYEINSTICHHLCFTACQLNHPDQFERPYKEQTKELNLENFNKVFISGASKATIQKGAYKIVVKGDSTDLTF